MNNETIGISTEVAIADIFDIKISDKYRKRGNEEIIKKIKDAIAEILNTIPNKPICHVAEGQNLVDFILEDKKTLSVKSNKKGMGRIPPQKIGQPTSSTFFDYLKKELLIKSIPNTPADKKKMFKKFVFKHKADMLSRYWANLFDCDYLLYVYDVLSDPKAKIFKKIAPPNFEDDKITFTQTADSWNESNTVKYDGITIGNFQVHNNRDCLKFRFDMNGIIKSFNL